MAASVQPPARPGGGRRSRARKHSPMHEINVTPFVDVMLVLLIIFMVTAPMLTSGVPLDLAESKASQQLQANKEPITLSVNKLGKVFIQESEITLDELEARLKAIAKNGVETQIFIRGDKGVDYGAVMRVMGKVKTAGFTKVSLITEAEGT